MKARESGGIEVAVKAISSHINDLDVCFAGCGTLNSVTLDNCKRLTK